MPSLILTRRVGESIRLMIDGQAEYLDVLNITGGTCTLRLINLGKPLDPKVERVRHTDSMQIAKGISVRVAGLSKGTVKLNFQAPKEVKILRTELIKEAL
jgi:carbon storage regulator CsrA